MNNRIYTYAKVTEMARKSSIPEEILRHIPCKCCRIQKNNGTYYVYKYSAVKLSDGTWSSDWGYCIGKIIPEIGFIPNRRYQKELEEQRQISFSDSTTDVAYGQYALLQEISRDVLAKLMKCFPAKRAVQIYSYAMIMCANGFLHVDQIDEFYRESVLSLQYDDLSFKMGYTALSNLLKELGMKGNPVRGFEQMLIDECSGDIAIDGHVVRSASENNDLAEPGYKFNELGDAQVNILIAYDAKRSAPLMYRTFRGSSNDKVSAVELLRSRRFRNVKFIVDNGFYSSTMIDLMSQDGNTYIIPLKKSSNEFKRIRRNLDYSSGEFVYKAGRKDTARVVYQEKYIDEHTRVIVFKDVDENNSKRKSYKQLMDLGERGYTQESYDKYCDWWGVYILQTTTDEPASEVYSDYKNRWGIETYNNYVKNDAGFSGLKFQSYYEQRGFDFVMLVTGLIHSCLNDAVRKLGKSSISTFDILIKAGHMRMVLEGDTWNLHNTRTKDIELLKSMGFTPELKLAIR